MPPRGGWGPAGVAGNWLVSVKRRHAESMLAGRKSVELRRRRLGASPGDVVWVYGTSPLGRLCAVATVDGVDWEEPSVVWGRHGAAAAVGKREFDAYFEGAPMACAIRLKGIRRVGHGADLASIRRASPGFQPPQFCKRLSDGDPVLRHFLVCARRTP